MIVRSGRKIKLNTDFFHTSPRAQPGMGSRLPPLRIPPGERTDEDRVSAQATERRCGGALPRMRIGDGGKGRCAFGMVLSFVANTRSFGVAARTRWPGSTSTTERFADSAACPRCPVSRQTTLKSFDWSFQLSVVKKRAFQQLGIDRPLGLQFLPRLRELTLAISGSILALSRDTARASATSAPT
jgi:hypothetical protein